MNRKLPLLLLVFLLGVLTFTIASGETVPVERQAAAQAEVNAKIHANLLADMKAASASTQLQFVARITEGTDLSAFAERWFARPFIDPLGTTVASGYATATGLQKMAAQPVPAPKKMRVVPNHSMFFPWVFYRHSLYRRHRQAFHMF